MARRNYSNIAVDTTLSSGIGSGDTSLVVASASGYPSAPFFIILEPGLAGEELILVGGKSGTSFTSLSRGQGGTSAAAHSGGIAIKHVVVALDFDKVWTHRHKVSEDDVAVDHADLTNVTANQHHNQAHAIGGADHTGTLDHGALSGLGDDDHPQYATDTDLTNHAAAADPHTGYRLESADHSHASAGLQGGTLDHGVLTGLSDDDHPQYLKENDVGSVIEIGAAFESAVDSTLSSSWEAGASVTFTKPGAWASYKIMAWGSVGHRFTVAAAGQVGKGRIYIDGNTGSEAEVSMLDNASGSSWSDHEVSCHHLRTGLTADAVVRVEYSESVGSSPANLKYNSRVQFIAIRTS